MEKSHTITLKDALRLWRKCGTADIVYMTYNREKGYSEGIKRIPAAVYLPQAKKGPSRRSILRYTDQGTGDTRQFWLPLLLFINGYEVTLKSDYHE